MHIVTSEHGFIYNLEDARALEVRWEEIETISYYRLVLPNEQRDAGFLVFDFENGEFVEVRTEAIGFATLALELAERFALPKNWQEATRHHESVDSIDIWHRSH